MSIPAAARVYLLALAFSLAAPLGAHAQTPVPAPVEAPLDPEAPMAPLPDLGVEWPDLADDPSVDTKQEPATTTENGEQRYRIVIEGIDPTLRAELLARFNGLSSLKQDEGKPANAAQIDRRAREDSDLLDSLLRSEGYYDADVEAQVETGDDGRLTVKLVAEPGPLYTFGSVRVTGLDEGDPQQKALRDGFDVEAQSAVDADKVIANRAALDAMLKAKGYPFAKVEEPDVVVDHDTQQATLDLAVDPGGKRNFGAIRLSGTKPPFDAGHVQTIARFHPGEVYNQADVDDLKRALIATGLVSIADVEPVPGPAPDLADIAVKIDRAPPRTIAGEAGYGTGEGIRVEGSWTHRNFIRPEGAVTFRGILGTREQYLGAILRQSNFGERDRVLNARITIDHADRPAFEARSFEIAAGLERVSTIIWQKKWTYSAGVELVTSDERDVVGAGIARRRTYYVGAVPLTLNYDGSDSLLDPKRGFRLGGRISPELSLQSGTFGYVRAQLDGSAYLPVNPKLVVAGRVRFGTIVGARSEAIAPSRRFYAGGGGSVRGYGFQEIGPRDIANNPDGGRSLAEFSLEARVRLGNFGVVPFLDGGNIYSKPYPRLSGFRYGAGIGARYYSNFGPIRIDVGTPVNPQKGDAPVTVFVSLGQAF